MELLRNKRYHKNNIYKVVLLESIKFQINDFISSIFQQNLNMFHDCWIDDVDFIERNYLEHSELLKKKILQEIHRVAKTEIIWKMQSESWEICFQCS